MIHDMKVHFRRKMSELELFREQFFKEVKAKRSSIIAEESTKKLELLKHKLNGMKERGEAAIFCHERSEPAPGTNSLDEYWKEQASEYKKLQNEVEYQTMITEDLCIAAAIDLSEAVPEESSPPTEPTITTSRPPELFFINTNTRRTKDPGIFLSIIKDFAFLIVNPIYFLCRVFRKLYNYWIQVTDVTILIMVYVLDVLSHCKIGLREYYNLFCVAIGKKIKKS